MKNLVKMTIGFVLCLSLLIYIAREIITTNIDTEKQKYERHLGEKYLIDGDTLTVTDYSIWRETFVLSNGLSISYEIISDNDNEIE